jgi:hypothetical protein
MCEKPGWIGVIFGFDPEQAVVRGAFKGSSFIKMTIIKMIVVHYN